MRNTTVTERFKLDYNPFEDPLSLARGDGKNVKISSIAGRTTSQFVSTGHSFFSK
jgi:hypothetical protein